MPLIGFNDGDLDARHGQGACRKRGRVVMGVPGRRAVGLAGDLLPDRHLALAVGRDGEGLQHFEVDLVGRGGFGNALSLVATPRSATVHTQ